MSRYVGLERVCETAVDVAVPGRTAGGNDWPYPWELRPRTHAAAQTSTDQPLLFIVSSSPATAIIVRLSAENRK
jgi:hypothetical protein